MSDALHITVGTAPEGKLSLQTDLKLIKAAVLYGDKVTLCSPSSTMIAEVSARATGPVMQRIGLLEQYTSYVPSAAPQVAILRETVARYNRLIRKRGKSKDEVIELHRLTEAFANAASDVEKAITSMVEAAGISDFETALSSGLLDLHEFKSRTNDDIIDEFGELIGDIIANHATYPLFDDQVGLLAKLGLQEGRFAASLHTANRGKHVALASDLFTRLPLFDAASVAEILHIRSELANPLTNFRAAMIRFSRRIESATWDDDFPIEADLLFMEEVAPAIGAIESAVQSNSQLLKILDKAAESNTLLVSGASGLAVSMVGGSSISHAVSALLGLSVGAGRVAFRGHREWAETQRDIEQNQLYFYYATGKRLEI